MHAACACRACTWTGFGTAVMARGAAWAIFLSFPLVEGETPPKAKNLAKPVFGLEPAPNQDEQSSRQEGYIKRGWECSRSLKSEDGPELDSVSKPPSLRSSSTPFGVEVLNSPCCHCCCCVLREDWPLPASHTPAGVWQGLRF